MAGLMPSQRFDPSYYTGAEWKVDPATGRVVRTGGAPRRVPVSPIDRFSDLDVSTAGLSGPGDATKTPGVGPARRLEDGERRTTAFRDFKPEIEAGTGRRSRPATQTADIDAIGGFSTLGTVAGLATGIPVLGLAGAAIDSFREVDESKGSFGLGESLSVFGHELSGGLIGQSAEEIAEGQRKRSEALAGLRQERGGDRERAERARARDRGRGAIEAGTGRRTRDSDGDARDRDRDRDNRGPGHGGGLGGGRTGGFGGPR